MYVQHKGQLYVLWVLRRDNILCWGVP